MDRSLEKWKEIGWMRIDDEGLDRNMMGCD